MSDSKAPRDLNPQPGDILAARWRVCQPLGQGGMSVVYRGEDLMGRAGAVKVMRAELKITGGSLRRFVREAVFARRVTHPAMVSLLDEGATVTGRPFVVWELLEGATLDQMWKSMAENLRLEVAVRVLLDALDLLETCHDQGIVHRDLKPSNLFVTRAGQVKVLDFGLAGSKEIADDFGTAGASVGTPSFMSPEQAMGAWQHVDATSDVFAIGAILYALVSGKRLHRAPTIKAAFELAATQAPAPVRSVAPACPPPLADVIDQCLRWDKRKRFPHARALRQRLSVASRSLDALTRGALVRAASGVESSAVAPASAGRAKPNTLEDALQLCVDASERGSDQDTDAALENASKMIAALADSGRGVLRVHPWCLTWGHEYRWIPRGRAQGLVVSLFDSGVRAFHLSHGVSNIACKQFIQTLLSPLSEEPSPRKACLADRFWERRWEGIGVEMSFGSLGADCRHTEPFVTSFQAINRLASPLLVPSTENLAALSARQQEAASFLIRNDPAEVVEEQRPSPSDASIIDLLVRLCEAPTTDVRQALGDWISPSLMSLEQAGRFDLVLRFVSSCSHDAAGITRIAQQRAASWLSNYPLSTEASGRRMPCPGNEAQHFEPLPVYDFIEWLPVEVASGVVSLLVTPVRDEVLDWVLCYVSKHKVELFEELLPLIPQARAGAGVALVRMLADQPAERLERVAQRIRGGPLELLVAPEHQREQVGMIGTMLDSENRDERLCALHLIGACCLDGFTVKLTTLAKSAGLSRWDQREVLELLDTLARLDRELAEKAAIAVLGKHGHIGDDPWNRTREVAMRWLGETTCSLRAYQAVQALTSPMWWNSARTRREAKLLAGNMRLRCSDLIASESTT